MPLLSFIDTNSVALAGMLSGFLVGGVFAIWPAFCARLYEPLVPISPLMMRRVGYIALLLGVWSTLALILRLAYGINIMPTGAPGT
jgi:hypothetical protein